MLKLFNSFNDQFKYFIKQLFKNKMAVKFYQPINLAPHFTPRKNQFRGFWSSKALSALHTISLYSVELLLK